MESLLAGVSEYFAKLLVHVSFDHFGREWVSFCLFLFLKANFPLQVLHHLVSSLLFIL